MALDEEKPMTINFKERDTLHREQNKNTVNSALLKEKDEIITQFVKGEELSKKQAARESTIKKLCARSTIDSCLTRENRAAENILVDIITREESLNLIPHVPQEPLF